MCQFEGAAGDEFQEQTAQLCSQQSQALELIKNKQRKDPRFAHIIQVVTQTRSLQEWFVVAVAVFMTSSHMFVQLLIEQFRARHLFLPRVSLNMVFTPWCFWHLLRTVRRVPTAGGCSSKTYWWQRCKDSPSILCCWTKSLSTQRVRNQNTHFVEENKMMTAVFYFIVFFPIVGSADLPSLHRAQACCRGILQAVNEVVRETEHRQSLSQYQRRLDPAPQFKVTKQIRCSLVF